MRISAELALPQAIAQDHDAIVVRLFFAGAEFTAKHGLEADAREESSGDLRSE